MNRLTLQDAKKKILRYCAYQERSHQEVKHRLYEFGLYSSEVDELISYLITEGFLNEERYARAFAGGKFRLKKWGRLKIIRELEMSGLTVNCIRLGLKEIDEKDYLMTLKDILQRKNDQVDEPNVLVRRNKIARYAIQKGYEPALVWEHIRILIPD